MGGQGIHAWRLPRFSITRSMLGPNKYTRLISSVLQPMTGSLMTHILTELFGLAWQFCCSIICTVQKLFLSLCWTSLTE